MEKKWSNPDQNFMLITMAQTVFQNLDQNNPVLKFVIFSANISVYVHPIVPKFDLMDSFLTLNKMTEQVFENSKILQNFGIKIESHQYEL